MLVRMKIQGKVTFEIRKDEVELQTWVPLTTHNFLCSKQGQEKGDI